MDPQVSSNALQCCARGGLVQVDGLPTELLGVVVVHGFWDYLASPADAGFSVSKKPGSGPLRVTDPLRWGAAGGQRACRHWVYRLRPRHPCEDDACARSAATVQRGRIHRIVLRVRKWLASGARAAARARRTPVCRSSPGSVRIAPWWPPTYWPVGLAALASCGSRLCGDCLVLPAATGLVPLPWQPLPAPGSSRISSSGPTPRRLVAAGVAGRNHRNAALRRACRTAALITGGLLLLARVARRALLATSSHRADRPPYRRRHISVALGPTPPWRAPCRMGRSRPWLARSRCCHELRGRPSRSLPR